MKKLLVALTTAFAFASIFAEEAKPAAKPAAKPTPKAPVKVAPDAGDWKPIDNKKGWLAGGHITDADLFMQPVIVIVFDPMWTPDSKTREEQSHKFVRLEPHQLNVRLQIVSTPSREIEEDEVPTFPKKYNKTSGFGPCYAHFGLVNPPVNKEMKFPFFYTVSIDRKIIFSGHSFPGAFNAAMADIGKHPGCNDMLGYYKPQIHAALAEKLKFGQSVMPVVQKLKPIANGKKESDARTEAQELLKIIDQSETYWERYALAMAGSQPPLGAMMCADAVKTFPKSKTVFQQCVTRIENQVGKPVLKIFAQIYGYKQKMPEKKADIKKAYDIVLKGEKMCNKAKKSYGDNLPYAFVALETLVAEVKMGLEELGAK